MKLKNEYIGEKTIINQLKGIVFRNTHTDNGGYGYIEILSFDHVGFDHPNRKTNYFMSEDPRHGILTLIDNLGRIKKYSKNNNENWFILDGKDGKDIYKLNIKNIKYWW